MKTILFLLFALPFLCSAETNPVALMQTNASISSLATNAPTVAPVSGSDLGGVLRNCNGRDSHPNSMGLVGAFYGYSEQIESLLNDAIAGNLTLAESSSGDTPETRNNVLIFYDTSNKIPFDKSEWDNYVVGLCSMPIGNEANITVLNTTELSLLQKKEARDHLIALIGGKMLLRRDANGKKLDLETLLQERQVNTIGLIALDSARPKELTPIHELDAEYEKYIGSLMDKAYENYTYWKTGKRPSKVTREKKPAAGDAQKIHEVFEGTNSDTPK